jgi:hypothetical protein
MNVGAFAFLDCLGFKGIWNRGVAPEQLLAFLREAQKHAEQSMSLASVKAFEVQVDPSLVFISDTVAISYRYKSAPQVPAIAAGYLVMLTAHLASEVCKRFSEAPVPLAFRGAITFGDHIAEDRFLIGPAVDEAAVNAETTEGAFIWLSPTSQRCWAAFREYQRTQATEELRKLPAEKAVKQLDIVFRVSAQFKEQTTMPQFIEAASHWWDRLTLQQKGDIAPLLLPFMANSRSPLLVENYPMEMKGGGYLTADVLNPLATVDLKTHNQWIGRILSGFSDSPVSVLMKKQNTERFLLVASQFGQTAFNENLARLHVLWQTIKDRGSVPLPPRPQPLT